MKPMILLDQDAQSYHAACFWLRSVLNIWKEERNFPPGSATFEMVELVIGALQKCEDEVHKRIEALENSQ